MHALKTLAIALAVAVLVSGCRPIHTAATAGGPPVTVIVAYNGPHPPVRTDGIWQRQSLTHWQLIAFAAIAGALAGAAAHRIVLAEGTHAVKVIDHVNNTEDYTYFALCKPSDPERLLTTWHADGFKIIMNCEVWKKLGRARYSDVVGCITRILTNETPTTFYDGFYGERMIHYPFGAGALLIFPDGPIATLSFPPLLDRNFPMTWEQCAQGAPYA